MAKKSTKRKLGSLISEIKEDIRTLGNEITEIPDIITFCESKEWLGLPFHPTNPIRLYPFQKLILKAFYRCSLGNENLELTEHELEMCSDLGLVDDDKGNVLEKYNNGEIFRELVLVWGRRSGKDFLVSIIALYESMKLLECPGGDPYSMYEISSATPINILTVATSKEQANIAYREIREKLLYSPYFMDKYIKEGMTAESVYLLTPKDKQDNLKFREDGLPLKKGSICVMVGHSNSDSLLGKGCIVLILDEVASYKATGGASSGDRIYTALTPTVSTYCRKTYKKDEDGNVVKDEYGQKIISRRIYDGKIISISSPRGKEGKFYELYETANQVPHRLVCRVPTWDVNVDHTRDSLRQSQPTMSDMEFNMEFGAEFSGAGIENFFTKEQVDSCFKGHNLVDRDMGQPGKVYFIHIDPAASSHNYALVVLHKEFYQNPNTKRSEFMIVVDHIKFWQPLVSPINPDEVTEYIIGLKRRFHIGLLTYDQWASRESILRMRKASIPNKETRFNHSHKNIIYRELENLVNEGRVKIPYNHILKSEMEELQRKWVPTGFRVLPRTDGDGVKSDDGVDCLAGAIFSAIEQSTNRLPHAKVVETGVTQQANNQVWRNMQGGAMYGTGQQVTNQLNRINSWPNRLR